MPELFHKVTDDTGVETYELIEDVSSVVAELDEGAIKAHPEYQRVNTLREGAVDESKKRLQRARKAESALQVYTAKDEEDAGDEPKPPGQEQVPAASSNQPIDMDALYADIVGRLAATQEQQSKVKQEQSTLVSGLMKTHKLDKFPGAEGIIRSSSDPEATALALGQSQSQFQATQGGATLPELDLDNMDFSGVRGMLNLPPKK